LEEALKWLKPLQKLASSRIEVQTLAYEVYIRQGLFLAALKALIAAKEIDAEDAKLHSQIINFRRRREFSRMLGWAMWLIAVSGAEVPDNVKSVIDATFPDVLPSSTSSKDFNAEFLSRHSQSPAHILGAARGLFEIKRSSEPVSGDTVSSIVTVLDKLTGEGVPPRIPVFLGAVALLKEAGASADQISDFEQKIKARVPLAEVFAPAEERKKQREEILAAKEETA
jgi:hypothetical protein